MTPEQKKRLVQLLGMLGSSHDGEVLNAAKMAQRHLGSMTMTWEEVLGGQGGEGGGGNGYSERDVEAAYQAGHASGYGKGYAEGKADAVMNGGGMRAFQSWRGVAEELLSQHGGLLTEWEIGFFENYVEKRWSVPTPKQRAVFEKVADKCGVSLPP